MSLSPWVLLGVWVVRNKWLWHCYECGANGAAAMRVPRNAVKKLVVVKAVHLQPWLPLELVCSNILIQVMDLDGFGKHCDLAFISFLPCVRPGDDLLSGGDAGLGWGAGLVAMRYQPQAGGGAAAPFGLWVPSSTPLCTQADMASLKAMLTSKPQHRASIISPSSAAASALGKVSPTCLQAVETAVMSQLCPFTAHQSRSLPRHLCACFCTEWFPAWHGLSSKTFWEDQA